MDSTYYQAHKEEIKAKRKIYNAANRDKVKAAQKVKYEKNKVKYAAQAKLYRAAHKEEFAARVKAYYSRTKEARRRYERNRKYGVSHEVFLSMLASQNNQCAVCGCEIGENADVDHCHKTKIVRGLLCSKCNTGIGLFQNSIENLEKAIRYLKSFN